MVNSMYSFLVITKKHYSKDLEDLSHRSSLNADKFCTEAHRILPVTCNTCQLVLLLSDWLMVFGGKFKSQTAWL